MAGRPRVSVVLVNSRAEEEELTVQCVGSLQAGERPPDQIVLVDNGSPPEVGARLRERLPQVALLQTGRNRGFTGGNNVGIEHALEGGADYVWVLNNDTEVEPDCLARLLATAEADPRGGCVGGKILHFDEPDRIWFAGGRFSVPRGLGLHPGAGVRDGGAGPRGARAAQGPQGPSAPQGPPAPRTPRDPADPAPPQEVTFLTGCCMFFRAEALREVGLFEEDFFIYVEDADLSWRMRTAGWRLLYDPSARLYHKVDWPEPEPPPHKIVLRDRNRRRLARRRFGPLDRLRFALFFYPSRAVLLARYLLRGDGARARAIGRGLTER